MEQLKNFTFTEGSAISLAHNLKNLLDENKIANPDLTAGLAWEFTKKYKNEPMKIKPTKGLLNNIKTEFFGDEITADCGMPPHFEPVKKETKNDAIKHLWFSGKTISEIAKVVCHDNSHAYQRVNNTVKKIKLKIKNLRESGKTDDNIAEMLGITLQKFNETLTKNGL